LFGNISFVLKSQGINVLLNLFFGTIINAAYGITLQVQAAVNMFVSNFQMAMNPQIVQSYAADDVERSKKLVMQGCKLSFFLMSVIVLPIVYNSEYVLNLWLKQLPMYTVNFVQLSLISILIDSVSSPIAILLQATGKIKWYQLFVGGFNLFVLPISYWCLHIGSPPVYVLFITLIFSFLSFFLRLVFASIQVDLSLKEFSLRVVVPIFLVVVFTLISLELLNYLFGKVYF